MRKLNQKANPALRIAAVLLCLTMFSFYMMSGMFARYTTSGRAQDDARVAKFKVSEVLKKGNQTAQTIALTLDPGEPNGEYAIVLTNDSEVALKYTIKVTQVGDLPLTITPANNGVGEIEPNGGEKNCTITVTLPGNDDEYQYHRQIAYLTVTVQCEQID